MTRLLAIETSSEACSVALQLGDSVLQRHQHQPLQHAELLLPAVHGLLDEAGVALSSLEAIVFGRGPGSFTSLRIGIGAVQGLAWGAELPVVPVSSLAAVAQAAWRQLNGDQGNADTADYILAAMDARMSEVFHGLFRVTEHGVVESAGVEAVSPPAEVVMPDAPGSIAAGNAFARYPELTRQARALSHVADAVLPEAVALLPLAVHWLRSHPPLPASAAQPVYVRDKVADKPTAN